MANDDSGGSFVTGFLLGGIVGAIVGILLAPKAGSETRAELAQQTEALRERAEEVAAKVREAIGPTVEVVREHVGPAMEGVRERVAPVAEAVTARVGRGTSRPAADGGPADDDKAEKPQATKKA